ncbi:MAG: TrbC/VirB2 family protein [Novosphingobium sp.]|nr:TrbC/VirB2 family protein [Novosphingobium sp.]MCP5402400.1 TrbC/VirB2 family protein [Novosphingobium sp.]
MIRIFSLNSRLFRPLAAAWSVLLAFLFPQLVHAQAVAGGSPAGSGPIVAALGWLQGTLLGNVATAVAVMAVAAVGFMMLTGRLNWRFGATVIIGCFILFGAGAIVSGIQSAAA